MTDDIEVSVIDSEDISVSVAEDQDISVSIAEDQDISVSIIEDQDISVTIAEDQDINVTISGGVGGSGVSNHSGLTELDYASAGHTGFQPTITSATNVTANSFITNSGTNSDFIKGDGSLDSTTYLDVTTAGTTYLKLDASNDPITSNLAITGKILLVGTDTVVDPYSGFSAQDNHFVYIGQTTETAIGIPYSGFVFANNQTGTENKNIAQLNFINTAIGGTEKRMAQILVQTDGAIDDGKMILRTFDSGSNKDAIIIDKSGDVDITWDITANNLSGTNTGDQTQEYMYPIWAEENNSLGNNTYEWAFGNGADTPSNAGITIYVPSGWTATIVAMTATTNNASGTSVIEANINGTLKGALCNVTISGRSGVNDSFTPVALFSGDRLTFRTTTAGTNTKPNTVTAWVRMLKD